MEDNEVELIDYLRVIWWGKWIILACLVVAVVVTGVVMWTRPDEYRGSATYQLSESLSALIPVQCAEVESEGVSGARTREAGDLSDALAGVDVASLGKGLGKASSVSGDRVTVTLSGAVPASRVRDALSRLTPLLEAQIAGIMQTHVTAADARVTLRLDQDTQQRQLLRQQMAAITSPTDPLLAALANEVAALELSIAQEQTALSMLQKTKPANLFTLETIGQATVSRTGPHRHIALAVAVVLGLFIGLLLAFFIHYLRSAARQERRSDRGKGNA